MSRSWRASVEALLKAFDRASASQKFSPDAAKFAKFVRGYVNAAIPEPLSEPAKRGLREAIDGLTVALSRPHT